VVRIDPAARPVAGQVSRGITHPTIEISASSGVSLRVESAYIAGLVKIGWRGDDVVTPRS
jgi:hypothetical protein